MRKLDPTIESVVMSIKSDFFLPMLVRVRNVTCSIILLQNVVVYELAVFTRELRLRVCIQQARAHIEQ